MDVEMSSVVPRFVGLVKGGKILLDEPENYVLYLQNLEEKRIELVIKKEEQSRTNQQSRYLFGVVYQLISEETGYSKEEVHEMMKSIFLKDHKVVNDKRYTVIKSSSGLSTVEMSEYIENCKRWAATELSLNIPESNEFYLSN